MLMSDTKRFVRVRNHSILANFLIPLPYAPFILVWSGLKKKSGHPVRWTGKMHEAESLGDACLSQRLMARAPLG